MKRTTLLLALILTSSNNSPEVNLMPVACVATFGSGKCSLNVAQINRVALGMRECTVPRAEAQSQEER